MIINTHDIHRILINPNKYSIQIISKKNDGYLLVLVSEEFHHVMLKLKFAKLNTQSITK